MAVAVTPGWRTYGLVIPGPNWMWSVAKAMAASVSHTVHRQDATLIYVRAGVGHAVQGYDQPRVVISEPQEQVVSRLVEEGVKH